MADKFEEIRKKLLQFRNERDWAKYHDPKNLAEAVSIESGELLENFGSSLISVGSQVSLYTNSY
jgi:hypothetical protein